MQSFRPIVGQFIDGRQLREIINPQQLGIDVACFMMLSQKFQLLLGVIIRVDNRKWSVTSFEDSNGWLYDIFHPIIVKVFANETPIN